LGKFNNESASAEVTPKLLAKQHLNIGLVINHENEHTHACPLDFPSDPAVQRKTSLNSMISLSE